MMAVSSASILEATTRNNHLLLWSSSEVVVIKVRTFLFYANILQ